MVLLVISNTLGAYTAYALLLYFPVQVVVPRLSTNGLRWQCSGDFVARQCLQYRGVLPVCADPSLGSPDGAILRAALQEVSFRPEWLGSLSSFCCM